VSSLGLSLLLVILVVPAMMEAQTASITGTLTDATGAVVQAAKVTARNTQTNASRSTQTGDTGVYRVTNLLPGVYEVLFEKKTELPDTALLERERQASKSHKNRGEL